MASSPNSSKDPRNMSSNNPYGFTPRLLQDDIATETGNPVWTPINHHIQSFNSSPLEPFHPVSRQAYQQESHLESPSLEYSRALSLSDNAAFPSELDIIFEQDHILQPTVIPSSVARESRALPGDSGENKSMSGSRKQNAKKRKLTRTTAIGIPIAKDVQSNRESRKPRCQSSSLPQQSPTPYSTPDPLLGSKTSENRLTPDGRTFRQRSTVQTNPYTVDKVNHAAAIKGHALNLNEVENAVAEKRNKQTPRSSIEYDEMTDLRNRSVKSEEGRSVGVGPKKPTLVNIDDTQILGHTVFRTFLKGWEDLSIPLYLKDCPDLIQLMIQLEEAWVWKLEGKEPKFCTLQFPWKIGDRDKIIIRRNLPSSYQMMFEEIKRAPVWETDGFCEVVLTIHMEY